MTGAALALHLAAVRRAVRADRRRREVLAGGWGRDAQAAALAERTSEAVTTRSSSR